MYEASLLTHVPHLITNTKSSGLLLASYGPENHNQESLSIQRQYGVDATDIDGVLYYNSLENHSNFAI